MYSVLEQAKTPLRDGQGMTVFRRLYLCDTEEDVAELPVSDAPGSGALVAEGEQRVAHIETYLGRLTEELEHLLGELDRPAEAASVAPYEQSREEGSV